MSWRIFLLCTLTLPLLAAADVPRHAGLVGLLEIPGLYSTHLPDRAAAAPIALRAKPSADSTILAALEQSAALASHEWAYEQPAAAVYGYLHDGQMSWYQLRLLPSAQFGWMAATKATVFHPLSALTSDSLSYLTAVWDRRVYRVAGDSATLSQLQVRASEVQIAVADSAIVDDKLAKANADRLMRRPCLRRVGSRRMRPWVISISGSVHADAKVPSYGEWD